MYYPIIRQCIQALKNLETWLDKAEQHAAAKGCDDGVLLTSRLAPDMKDFIYQVQSACDYTKGAAAWLSGQKPPRHELHGIVRIWDPPPQVRFATTHRWSLPGGAVRSGDHAGRSRPLRSSSQWTCMGLF